MKFWNASNTLKPALWHGSFVCLCAPIGRFWSPKTCRKFAYTSLSYAEKKAAPNPAKCALKPQMLLAKQKKKNTLTYAHKAASNAAKQKDHNQKETLMWHNNMIIYLLKGRN
jgi:hypothetical protein